MLEQSINKSGPKISYNIRQVKSFKRGELEEFFIYSFEQIFIVSIRIISLDFINVLLKV